MRPTYGQADVQLGWLNDLMAQKAIKFSSQGGARMNEAGRVEKHYRAALQGEIDRLERDVNELHELLVKAEAEKNAAVVESLQAWKELEQHQDALLEAEDAMESFSEADTITYELSPKDRLELAHLDHRHNLLAERVEGKLAPAIRDAARANHRSRWLLGLVFLLVASAMLTWATFFGVS